MEMASVGFAASFARAIDSVVAGRWEEDIAPALRNLYKKTLVNAEDNSKLGTSHYYQLIGEWKSLIHSVELALKKIGRYNNSM